MQPATPVFPGRTDLRETVYAANQPEYQGLPAVRFMGTEARVTTRWRLSWRERLRVLWYGDLYLSILTFKQPLQPIKLEVRPPLDSVRDAPRPGDMVDRRCSDTILDEAAVLKATLQKES